jgi:hypothetical protein
MIGVIYSAWAISKSVRFCSKSILVSGKCKTGVIAELGLQIPFLLYLFIGKKLNLVGCNS